MSHLAAGGRAVIVGELVFLQDPIGFGVSQIRVRPVFPSAWLKSICLPSVEGVDDAGDLHGFIEPKCALWIELSWTHAIQNVQLTGGFDDALFAGSVPLALVDVGELLVGTQIGLCERLETWQSVGEAARAGVTKLRHRTEANKLQQSFFKGLIKCSSFE